MVEIQTATIPPAPAIPAIKPKKTSTIAPVTLKKTGDQLVVIVDKVQTESPSTVRYDLYVLDSKCAVIGQMDISVDPIELPDGAERVELYSMWTYVATNWRRKGVATLMYDMAANLAAEHGAPLVPSGDLSQDAVAFWETYNPKLAVKIPKSDIYHTPLITVSNVVVMEFPLKK